MKALRQSRLFLFLIHSNLLSSRLKRYPVPLKDISLIALCNDELARIHTAFEYPEIYHFWL